MNKRKKIIAGNWKMNNSLNESIILAISIQDSEEVDIIIAPPFVHIERVKDAILGKNIFLSAQNMYFEERGAFTGEISPIMLKDLGCSYVIIGHSERRHIFGENDILINKKTISAIEHNLNVILCVGETKQQRQNGETEKIVESQLDSALKDISEDKIKKIIIAYEPVWAIGTGLVATPEQAEEMHLFIRKKISERYSKETSNMIRILYGGSVNAENAESLLSKKNVDGLLIGGASLKAKSFNEIIKIAERY